MGFLDNISKSLDKSLDTSNHKIIKPFLLENEVVELLINAKEDIVCLTNRRFIFTDNKTIGSKKTITSIAYSKITAISWVQGGTFSVSKNIILTLGSRDIEVDLFSEEKAMTIYKLLASKVY